MFTNSQVVYDEQLGYSFEIPQGFEIVTQQQPGVNYSYIRSYDTQTRHVLNIQHLGGRIGQEKVSIEMIREKTPFPEGTEIDELTVEWQGHTLFGHRTRWNSEVGPLTIFAVQIPISKEAIQIHFGGPNVNETETLEMFQDILASVHGKSNWRTQRL